MKALFTEVLHTYQRMLNDSSLAEDHKKMVQETVDNYNMAGAIINPTKAIAQIVDGAHVLYHHTREVSLRPMAANRLNSIVEAEIKVRQIIANSVNN